MANLILCRILLNSRVMKKRIMN